MIFKIETPNAPSKLILAWEAPKTSVDRTRWAIGELNATPSGAEFHYYLGVEFSEKNCGREYQKLLDAGYVGFPSFYPADKPQVFSVDVITAFRRRLPPEKRSDFQQYLMHYGLDVAAEVDDMTLLGVTGARLPSDGFELVDPLTARLEQFEVAVQIAGYRHYLDNARDLKEGAKVLLNFDSENQYDPCAIAFTFDGKVIGHVNRLQVEGLRWLMDERSIEAYVQRFNGTSSYPRAYVYLKVRPGHHRYAA